MSCVSSSSPLLRVADRAVLPWLTLICDGKEPPLQDWWEEMKKTAGTAAGCRSVQRRADG